MPKRSPWEPSFSVGHEAIDAQHRALLAQCDRLADLCATEEVDEASFRAAFDTLMSLAQDHFTAEEALLTVCDYPEIENYRCEREEYQYLADEIATPENFDPIELQRFLALWWVGHILDAARGQRNYLNLID